jgi:formylglycine-generating enzyme required for sulfatase activity
MRKRQNNLFQWMIIVSICIGGMVLDAVNPMNSLANVVNKKLLPSLMTAMVSVPASEITKMPFGKKDAPLSVNIPNLLIGKTEVTGKLWGDVYDWAVNNGYVFAHVGENRGTTKPVTRVSWYDVIVWCNAYSQKEGLNPVYRDKNGKILRNAKEHTVLDNALQFSEKHNGYHLPTSMQWEMAARWLGTTKPRTGSLARDVKSTKGRKGQTYYWTPAHYLSGAIEDFRNKNEANKVAWFDFNLTIGTVKSVCRKRINALLMCDVSGNVSEWLYDKKEMGAVFIHISTSTKSREIRGGDFLDDISDMTVSSTDNHAPYESYWGLGFRLAKTAKK